MKFHVKEVQQDVPKDVTIVAATKYFTAQEMRELYHEGITHFGENRVESLLEKQEELIDLDITWHYIGTLQTKKVKKIIKQLDFLHSLDTIKLAQEINKRREKPLPCFIQVNISSEESKHGLSKEDVIPFLKELQDYPLIKPIGFMGMAAYTEDETQINRSFQLLNDLQEKVRIELGLNLNELSIGMSNDYKIAIKHKATMIRLGSVLFSKEG